MSHPSLPSGRDRPRSLLRCVVVFLALAAPLGVVRAQLPAQDTTDVREISPGVTLTRITRPYGRMVLHVLTLDLRRHDLAIRAVRACDRQTGRERPSSIARRLRSEGLDVVAVLNAGFFDLEGGTGTSESNVVVDGEIVKGVAVTESPFDRFDNAHSQFGVTSNGHPVIDRFRLTGTVRMARSTFPLGSVNGAPVPDAVSLYTEWADHPPRFPTASRSAAVPVSLASADSDSARYRVDGSVQPKTGTADTSAVAGALVVGTGRAAAVVATLRTGDVVTIVRRFAPSPSALATLVGGWPRIVRDGVNIALAADSIEGTSPGFSRRRHPRSAVGISRDSTLLYLVAVDGRRSWSPGMSLDELANALIAIGAYDALNLDGGGSTALVVGDSIVNTPSDETGERAVGDVIVITRQQGSYQRRAHPAAQRIASCVTSATRDPDRAPSAPK